MTQAAPTTASSQATVKASLGTTRPHTNTDVVELNSFFSQQGHKMFIHPVQEAQESSRVLQTTPGREHPFKSRPSQDWVAGTHL